MHFSPFDYEQSWTPQQFIKVEIILKYLVVFSLSWSSAWGVRVGEKARNFHSCLKTPQPCSPFWVSNQGRKSGKDCRIPGPVGALIKLPGSHSRTHMVSETMLSSNFCWLFCFEGQRVPLNSFLLFPLCGGHRVCSRQAGQHSPRARAT